MTELDPACRFVAAIPPVAADTEAKPQLPGRKPDDPTLEAAFRFVLRNERTPAEIDQRLAEVQKYVEGKPALQAATARGLEAGRVPDRRIPGRPSQDPVRFAALPPEDAGDAQCARAGRACSAARAMPAWCRGPRAVHGRFASERQRCMPDASGLVGYWPLQGDCQDHSGAGRHGINHGVELETAQFNGRDSFIEVPAAGLNLGTNDFTISAWVHTEEYFDDVIGDVVSQYDAARRKGLNLYIRASAGGYNSQGDDRHVYFGIDNAQLGPWEDCGRPSATSNYVSNSMTVFDGQLYVGITDAEKKEDWAHVFRYQGGTSWEDCGRVTDREAHGAGPMIVHDDNLYVATWNYDWTRVAAPPGVKTVYDVDFCHVYRYAGDQQWIDCGQPGQSKRLFGIASYKGSLYVVGDDMTCQRYQGGTQWERVGSFIRYGHPMGIHDGRLFVGLHNPASVQAYDGTSLEGLAESQPDAAGRHTDACVRRVSGTFARHDLAGGDRRAFDGSRHLGVAWPVGRCHGDQRSGGLQREALRRCDSAR